MYALEPDAIYARRSRHAYGVETASPFKRGLRQDLRYTDPDSNKVLCKKLFSSLVQLDELVEHDQVNVNVCAHEQTHDIMANESIVFACWTVAPIIVEELLMSLHGQCKHVRTLNHMTPSGTLSACYIRDLCITGQGWKLCGCVQAPVSSRLQPLCLLKQLRSVC